MALSADTSVSATKHVPLCLQSILESCSISDSFMTAFCVHPDVPRLLEGLLLNEPRVAIRQGTALLIRQTCVPPVKDGERYGRCAGITFQIRSWANTLLLQSLLGVAPSAAKLRGFFWPLVSRLVRPAITGPVDSTEVLNLCFEMLQTLGAAQSEISNLKQLSDDWFDLLLGYTTTEVCPNFYSFRPLSHTLIPCV